MKLKKIKAGALQFIMFIVVVIALLLAAFIILVHTHKQFNIQTDFILETIENANKGIDYVLHNGLSLNDSLSINLSDEDYKTVTVHRDYWGIFEKVIVISKIKTNTFRKVTLVGAVQSKTNRTALFLEDQNKPLVLVGNTKIEGVAYLPKQGVRTGNISGHSYYGEQLIYGATKPSGKLPELSKEILDQIKGLPKQVETIDVDQFLDISEGKSYQNTFFEPLKVVYSNTDIHLVGVKLTGHIMVQSKTKIRVDPSSNLKDVVLVAPQIEIRDDVKGVFQAIASEEIKVGKNCELDYPSTLVLQEETKPSTIPKNTSPNNETPVIKLEKGSTLKGIIVYLGETKNYKAQVFVDEQATVKGELYCNRNLELLGTVKGTVFNSGFMASKSGSSYQNHLYNGTIIVDSLAQEYKGVVFENLNKGIAKWLY